jgi:hypothetical protein
MKQSQVPMIKPSREDASIGICNESIVINAKALKKKVEFMS